jgi:hypothetical protein
MYNVVLQYLNKTLNFNMSVLEFVASIQTYRIYVTLHAFLFSIPYVCPLFIMGEGEGGPDFQNGQAWPP